MTAAVEQLVSLVHQYPRLVALTGAGVSVDSGIPTYRNDRGDWQRSLPILHQEFVHREASRRRYWARSLVGWHLVATSRPNPAHHALATLERLGYVDLLVTQNVDRLHQRAGHQRVVDLHGRLDRVICRACGARLPRARVQTELEALNPSFEPGVAEGRPDGDADLTDGAAEVFRVPPCARCGGVLMPDVVFFGGRVPQTRVERVRRSIEDADALLVAGSSLSVYSGYRFCRHAAGLGKPVLIVNRGWTRADELAALKLETDCVTTLQQLALELHPQGTS